MWNEWLARTLRSRPEQGPRRRAPRALLAPADEVREEPCAQRRDETENEGIDA